MNRTGGDYPGWGGGGLQGGRGGVNAAQIGEGAGQGWRGRFESHPSWALVASLIDHLPNQIFAVTCTIVICYDSCHHTPSKILISVKFSRNPIKVRYKTSTRTVITVI